jgi:PST family polysaccharide transporter
MRRLLNRLDKNLLLKVAGFNSIYIILRIAIGVVMSKVIAVYVGAAGMAVMGNLRNFTQGIWTFSVLGLENGLVKHAAQFQQEKHQLKQVFQTAWSLCLLTSVVLGIICIALASHLDQWLIGVDTDFSVVFIALGISLPFHVLFVMLSSLLQGLEWFKRFIWINILVSVLVFITSALLIYNYNLTGALFSIVLVPVLQCLVILAVWWRVIQVPDIQITDLLRFSFDNKHARNLLKYSIMALVSALLIPVVQIAVRQKIMYEVSDEAAGYWEAVVRVSTYYMMFVTTLISLYVLPSLSKDSAISNYRKTVWHFYKSILPIVLAGLITLFLSRELLVELLFTAEFTGATPLFKWQFAGDFFKVVTTVLAFRFIALNDLKRYLIAEVLSVISFLGFSYYLIPMYQEEGVVMAHLLNYVFYLLILLILLRKEIFAKLA